MDSSYLYCQSKQSTDSISTNVPQYVFLARETQVLIPTCQQNSIMNSMFEKFTASTVHIMTDESEMRELEQNPLVHFLIQHKVFHDR